MRLLYELGAPAWVFRLVPSIHFFAAATGLGALCARLSGRSAGAAAFGLFLLASFALQQPTHSPALR